MKRIRVTLFLLLLPFLSLFAQERILMPDIQMVNLDAQYEERLSNIFIDAVNSHGKYIIGKLPEDDFLVGTIMEGCAKAARDGADYYLTAFINISNNKVYFNFYLYSVKDASLVWKEDLRNLEPKEIESILARIAPYVGDNTNRLSDEFGNPYIKALEKRFILDRWLTYGARFEIGSYFVSGKKPAIVFLPGVSMQYDIKTWFFEPSVMVGFGNVRPILYSFSVNKIVRNKHTSPYYGFGFGNTRTTARLNKMSPAEPPDNPQRITDSGGYYFIEAGYFLSRRDINNWRIAIRYGFTAFDILDKKLSNISISATFSMAP
jgi:hypothetical protein